MVGARYGKMEEYDIVVLGDDIRYYKKGTDLFHRLDGPAICANGRKQWWVDGQLHRIDGPAFECDFDGSKLWYVDGLQHRLDGPAIDTPRCKGWYVNGLCHRLDGPALEYPNGDYVWMVNGNIHRLDGPAYCCWGKKQWHINGERLSPEKENVMNMWYENGRI